jgi:hypothetical protein
MWLKELLWKYVIRRAARKYGFLDPFSLLAQIRRFAPPSEVSEPIELIRAGVLFHARGLINRQAIQHNLDWIWPFWVEQQFNPHSESFLPRSFSITHVNLTHRNWTAVGVPGCDAFPIVDPRGLITPFWDGWSLDGWIISENSKPFVPSRLASVRQELLCDITDPLIVRTVSQQDQQSCEALVCVESVDDQPVCRIHYQITVERPAWFVVALRPYNPEGISFIHDIILSPDQHHWTINNKEECVHFSLPVEQHAVSTYQHGDVFHKLQHPEEETRVHCDVGLATAAAMYRILPDQSHKITVGIQLAEDPESTALVATSPFGLSWSTILQRAARLKIPDKRFQFLYDAALRSLILLSPDWTYPGPFTYKRFWYRDAAFLLHALLCTNMIEQAERVLDRFPEKQTLMGYFHSQEGEWDTNGEVLWTFSRFCELTGKQLKTSWLKAVTKGAEWIVKKRLADHPDEIHAGLFPPGFSAEHLGNIDYYYWDNFWNVAGLQAAAALLVDSEETTQAETYRKEAEALMRAIERSLEMSRFIQNNKGIPASPYRRMDSGAVGSLVAGYPLRLLPPNDPRLLSTVDFLLEHCFVHGAFFQDMIHSGINAYLSLHVAQVLLRSRDSRFFDIVRSVADLASPTGQWPEAVHPRTKGGCMGDGQHAWASAEWLMMLRNMFVQEGENGLILAAGIVPEWLKVDQKLYFGPTPTSFGTITVEIEPSPEVVRIAWKGDWRDHAPGIEIMLPGFLPVHVNASEKRTAVSIERERPLDDY